MPWPVLLYVTIGIKLSIIFGINIDASLVIVNFGNEPYYQCGSPLIVSKEDGMTCNSNLWFLYNRSARSNALCYHMHTCVGTDPHPRTYE
jgi:hypothetical protein